MYARRLVKRAEKSAKSGVGEVGQQLATRLASSIALIRWIIPQIPRRKASYKACCLQHKASEIWGFD